jgi:hypothetical protein
MGKQTQEYYLLLNLVRGIWLWTLEVSRVVGSKLLGANIII